MEGKVAIITGASSGVGEATALRLAELGCNVVLAARRKKPLQQTADTCTSMGVTALAVVTDVTKESDVTWLAKEAIKRFGGFDIWINNAGVTSVGAFDQTPPYIFKRVIDTNLFGTVYGSREALAHFREKGYGTLINMSSVFGITSAGLESAYAASKAAIRSLTESLRQELIMDGLKHIHACTVLPATLDTPIYHNAANYTGHEVIPPAPIYSTDMAVNAIVGLIDRPQAEVIVGHAGRWAAKMHNAMPVGHFDNMFARYLHRCHFTNQAVPVNTGNLLEPTDITGVSGQWDIQPKITHKTLAIAGAAVAVAGIALLIAKKHKHKKGK